MEGLYGVFTKEKAIAIINLSLVFGVLPLCKPKVFSKVAEPEVGKTRVFNGHFGHDQYFGSINLVRRSIVSTPHDALEEWQST